MTRLVIAEIINSDLAVTSETAKLVNEKILENINHNELITLDFTGIKTLTTAFLNIAIGELYNISDPETLNRLVKFDVSTLTKLQFSKIKLVMENSKEKLTKIDDDFIDEVTLNG